MSAPAISCRGLKKHYGDVKAVDGLDLEVAPGECFGLLGPNGAGKTTTIEILEGLTVPDAGEVTVLGRHWGSQERELRERLGVSLQESRLTEKLTVYETLELFRSFYERGRSPGAAPGRPLARGEAGRPRRQALGRPAAAARRRLRARGRPRDPLSRRAHDGPRSPEPPPALGAHRRVQGRRPHGPAHDALHGGSRAALRARRDRRPRPDHRPRHAGAARRGPSGAALRRVLDGASRGRRPALPASPGSASAAAATARWFVGSASLAETVPSLLATLDKAGARLVSLSTHRSTLEDVFISLTGRELRDE